MDVIGNNEGIGRCKENDLNWFEFEQEMWSYEDDQFDIVVRGLVDYYFGVV
nr:hypothetical protein [Staphylococcus capitis]